MLNSLAAHHAGLAVQEKDATEKERLFALATQLLNKADPIDVNHELTQSGKGSLMLAKGDLARADSFFVNALQVYVVVLLQQPPRFVFCSCSCSCC